MSMIKILDSTVANIEREAKNINGIPGIKFFFIRKTIDTSLPIEISFVRYDNEVHAVCKQIHDGRLDLISIDGRDVWAYKNDVIFDKQEIEDFLDTLPLEVEANTTTTTIADLFGIDISNVATADGFEFDKLIYIDRMDADGVHDYFDGYMMTFTDLSTKTLKMGIHVGELMPYTYSDYLDKVNEYGKNRLLSEIIVDNSSSKTTLINNSEFRVKVSVGKYTYIPQRVSFIDKNYIKEDMDSFDIVLEPKEEFTLVHSKNQKTQVYNLLNPIGKPPAGPIYVSDNDQYVDALEFISEEPFTVEFKEVMSVVGANDPDTFITVGAFHDIFQERNIFNRAIVDKRDNHVGLKIHNTHGFVEVSSDEKLKRFIADGSISSFASRIKVAFKAKLRRIYSYLGEDQMNLLVDYSLASTRMRILSLENRIVYNDTISAPLAAFTVTIGLIGSPDEVMTNGSHLEYENVITKKDVPCKNDREQVVRKIMNSELFTSSYLRFNANDVINNPTKKVFSGPPYRTYNGELDDAYEQFQATLRNEINGFSLINSPAVLTSKEFAAVMPSLNMHREFSNGCTEDFVYSVEDNIAELGLEANMEEVLTKMRKVAYIYRKKDEIIATVTLGLTLDEEWYFCGEDFYPADAINTNEFTTYLDNEIVSLHRDMEEGMRPVSDKKKFLDSNDWGEDYKQQMHDAFMAIVVGSIKTSTVNDNPGLRYIVEHLIDTDRKLSFSYNEMFLHARDALYSKPLSAINNTLVMPNIFDQLIDAGKSGYSGFVGDDHKHFFGKAKAEYTRNYADLNVSDAYDSAYEIGHNINVMMNINAMRSGARLFDKYGKMMFGVNLGDFTVVDTISVTKDINIFMGNEKYAFCVNIVKNGDILFRMAYDYKSRKMKFDNVGNVEIVHFPLLLATFDIFIHDFYDTLEGYKRVSLGVYDYFDSVLPDGTLSKKYLFSNRRAMNETRFDLHHVVVGVYDESISVAVGEETSVNKILGYGGLGTALSVTVSTDEDNLTVQKDGFPPMVYSLNMLESYPDSRIVTDGITLNLYRTKRFLPTRFKGESLTRCIASVVSTTRNGGDVDGVVGDVKFIDFGEIRTIDTFLTGEIALALGGEGLQIWTETSKYASPPVIIVGIDDIMSSIGSVFNISMLGYDIELVFE